MKLEEIQELESERNKLPDKGWSMMNYVYLSLFVLATLGMCIAAWYEKYTLFMCCMTFGVYCNFKGLFYEDWFNRPKVSTV